MSAQSIAIVTDSTAHLPPDVRERLGISVIPLNVIWGDEILKDGVDIDPPTFYRRLQTAKVMPTTSQPSAGEFVEFFRRVAEEQGTDTIVGAYISSQLSGTVASAEAAKKLLPDLRIEIIDSRSTSMGQGFQVIAAAEAARAGASVEEVLAAAGRVRERLYILFMVDTLEFLHRGGRIGGGKRFLGTALQIKPLLGLDGVIEGVEQVRTKKKALARMLELMRERAGTSSIFRAAVIHANALEDARALAEEVRAQLSPEELYLAEVSPVIGTHTGPGTLGVCIVTR